MEAPVQIFMLGSLYACVSGQTVTRFYSQKAELLLARLALSPDRAFGREELIEWLWPAAEVSAGRTNLRSVLAALRRALEGEGIVAGTALKADRQRVTLISTAFCTDVAAFESRVHTAMQATGKRARAEALTQAIGLYRGHFLPGLYDDWALQERERLAGLFAQALKMQARLHEREGHVTAAIEAAQRLMRESPLDESALRLLLQLLLENGQKEQARLHYAQFAQRLQTELGAAPEAATLTLAARYLPSSTSSSYAARTVPFTEKS